MRNSFFQKIHSFVFWFNNATEHPIIEFIFIIGYAFLGFLCSFLSVLVVSSIVGITFSYSSKKLYTILVLSIFFLLSKSAIELIDGHLVLKGAVALNKANKDIVVPSLSNIPYQDIKSTRIQQLLTEIQNLVRSGDSSKIGQIFRSLWNFISSIFGFILLSSAFSRLNPLIILFVSTLFLFSSLIRRKLSDVSLKNHNRQMKANNVLRYIERLNSDNKFAKDIRAYDWSETISRRLHDAINEKCRYHMKEEIAIEGSRLASYTGRVLSLFLVVWSFTFMSTRIIDLKIDEVTFLFLSINSIWSWLETAVQEWQNLTQASNDISKFREIMKYNEMSPIEQINPEYNKPPYIVFDSVSFGYKKDCLIFDNLNLSIMQGERIGLIGENGCGKTTLILLLLGLLKPDDGRILIDGKDLNEYERRVYFAPVFQYLRLYPSSLGNNIYPFDELSKDNKFRILSAAQGLPVSSIIEKAPHGLDTSLVPSSQDGAVDLSGGEIQWIMILRALMKDSPIFVFDEINSALDYFNEESLYDLLNKIPSNKTLFFISHRLSFSNICSRIICFADGRVIEDGAPNDLMNKKGLFHELFIKEKRMADNEI